MFNATYYSRVIVISSLALAVNYRYIWLQ